MNKNFTIKILFYALVYGLVLTVWAMLFNAARAQSYSWVFGFFILGIIYYYLRIALARLQQFTTGKMHLVICGALITFLGCVVSTTFLWYYNQYQGLSNSIFKSIQSTLANGVFGLIISAILVTKLKLAPPSIKPEDDPLSQNS